MPDDRFRQHCGSKCGCRAGGSLCVGGGVDQQQAHTSSEHTHTGIVAACMLDLYRAWKPRGLKSMCYMFW